MFKLIVTLIFISFLEITNTTDPITLLNSSITTVEQADAALAKIEPNEALPLVLFNYIYDQDTAEEVHVLRLPEDINKAVTVDGKMVGGTQFYSPTSKTQMFFCPEENSDKPYNYQTTEVVSYEFCYDEEKQKTLYTIHLIKLPRLLSSKLLYWEQNMSYPFLVDDKYKTANFERIKNALDSATNPYIKSKYPMYDVQKLVPSQDKPLAIWQKTLHKFINVELQHKLLLPLWNMINNFVIDEAVRTHDNTDYLVRTGVFDITSTSNDNTQLYNIWMKVIQLKSKQKLFPSQAVVILMNNFLDSAADKSKLFKSREMKIESYCKENACVDTLIKKFTDIKGRVRCCPLTRNAGELFGIHHIYKQLPLLKIPGVTVDEN